MLTCNLAVNNCLIAILYLSDWGNSNNVYVQNAYYAHITVFPFLSKHVVCHNNVTLYKHMSCVVNWLLAGPTVFNGLLKLMTLKMMISILDDTINIISCYLLVKGRNEGSRQRG